MSKSDLHAAQCYYWKGWLRCLSSGFAELAPWTVAKHKASFPWPLPTHLLGVGDGLFVPQLSWKKVSVPVGGWEEGALQGGISRGKQRIAGLGHSAWRNIRYPTAISRWSCSGFAVCRAGASLPVSLGQLIPPQAAEGAPCSGRPPPPSLSGGMGVLSLGLNLAQSSRTLPGVLPLLRG